MNCKQSACVAYYYSIYWFLCIAYLLIGAQTELVVDGTDALGTEKEENLSEIVLGGGAREIHRLHQKGRQPRDEGVEKPVCSAQGGVVLRGQCTTKR